MFLLQQHSPPVFGCLVNRPLEPVIRPPFVLPPGLPEPIGTPRRSTPPGLDVPSKPPMHSSSMISFLNAHAIGQGIVGSTPDSSRSSSTSLTVSPDTNASGNGQMESPLQMRKLFVGGLSHDTSDDSMRSYFSRWGSLVDAVVIRDPLTKVSRGFGFVTFENQMAADDAMASKPHVIGGKIVDSKRAIPRDQMCPPPPRHSICIQQLIQMAQMPMATMAPVAPQANINKRDLKVKLSGISPDYKIDFLHPYFSKFGRVDEIEVSRLVDGVGFVVFADKEGLNQCLAHTMLGLVKHEINVIVKKADY